MHIMHTTCIHMTYVQYIHYSHVHTICTNHVCVHTCCMHAIHVHMHAIYTHSPCVHDTYIHLMHVHTGIRMHYIRFLFFFAMCLLYLAEAIYYDHITEEKIGVNLETDCNFDLGTSEYRNNSYLRCIRLQ